MKHPISVSIKPAAAQTAKEKKRLEVLVSELSPGPKRDEIRQEIRQLETAASVDKWVSSPGLKSPR